MSLRASRAASAALIAAVVLVGCGTDGGDGRGGGAGELRRTTIVVDVEGRGPLELDLTEDPPVIDPGYASSASPAPVDLAAARQLRDWVFALQEADPDCPAAVVPRLAVEVFVLPPPDVAERADMATYAFAGRCRDVDAEQLQEFVQLWNAAGGDLEVDAPT